MNLMNENKFNSEEIRNLIKNDISNSVFIEAGAGAGKTTSIVGRVLNQIKAGIEPKRIVIITFTNKATEEILSRINEAVYNALNEEKDAIKKEILTNAFNNLGSMNISTIHSFCYTLLSEKSLNIKLPVGVELAEDDELDLEMRKIFNIWIKSLSKNDYDILANDEILNKNIVERIYKYFLMFSSSEVSTYEILKFEYKKLLEYKEKILNYIDKLIEYANEFSSLTEKDFLSVIKADGKTIIDLKDDFMAIDFNKFMNYEIDEAKDIISNINSKIKNALLTTRLKKQEIKDYLNEFNDSLIELYEDLKDDIDYIKETIYVISEQNKIIYAYKAYEFYKEKRQRIKISKDELLYLTDQIIKDRDARLYFASKYDCIYVDEFQDTDQIQADLIWNLTSEIDDIHKNLGKEYGSLVVVGDPKQSIYRFRGADPSVFFKIKDEYINKKSVIYSLNYNFRSNNLILDYINKEFEKKDIESSSSNYSPMLYNDNHIVPKPISDKCIAGVFKLNSDPNLKEEEAIALLIRNLIDNKYLIPKFDRTKKIYEWSLIDYNDFLVLFHQFNNSNRFLDAFKKYNIPVSVAGRVDFKNEHGLKVFRRLYRGIVTPNDKIAKMGAIEALRMNNYDKSFINEDDAFNFYNDLFNNILNETKELSGYAKALYLKEHLEYILGDNDSYQSIYVKLTQAIENALANSISNAISLADYFDKYFESDIKEELILDNSISTIRFMNAHKSKGLEANIVIWADNGTVCNKKTDIFKDGNKYYFGIKLDKELRKKAELEEMREYARLEYVASTRAMNVLIFSNYIEDEKLFKRTNYDYHLNDLKDYQIGVLPNDEVIIFKQLKNVFYDAYDKKIDYEISPSIIHMSPSKYEIHEERKKIINSFDRPFGNVLGTIMHRALELLILRRKNNNLKEYDIDLNQIAKNTILESSSEFNIRKDYDKYYKFIISVLKNTLKYYQDINLLDNAIFVEPEYSYSLYDDSGIDEFKINKDLSNDIYLTGTMDLFIKYENKILIIDYKSDFIGYENDEQFIDILKKEYQNQLYVYRKSAEIMFDIKDIETKIIYYKNYDSSSLSITPVEVEIK